MMIFYGCTNWKLGISYAFQLKSFYANGFSAAWHRHAWLWVTPKVSYSWISNCSLPTYVDYFLISVLYLRILKSLLHQRKHSWYCPWLLWDISCVDTYILSGGWGIQVHLPLSSLSSGLFLFLILFDLQ